MTCRNDHKPKLILAYDYMGDLVVKFKKKKRSKRKRYAKIEVKLKEKCLCGSTETEILYDECGNYWEVCKNPECRRIRRKVTF